MDSLHRFFSNYLLCSIKKNNYSTEGAQLQFSMTVEPCYECMYYVRICVYQYYIRTYIDLRWVFSFVH